MSDIEILTELIGQDYPLTVTRDAAQAIARCFRRVMDFVSDDDRVFVAADYDLATSALWHPEGNTPRTNEEM